MKKAALSIALLTDFGMQDGYAGALKAVLMAAAPKIPVIDVTHGIQPGNILSASYVLYSVFDHFPAGTVFVCVVDPGVGTKRKALVAYLDQKHVIAPDNGIISLLVRMKPKFSVHELKADTISAAPCATFHGRDVFAPAAGLLVRGKQKKITGEIIEPIVSLKVQSKMSAGSTLEGYVMHIDRFGNAVTSIHELDLGPYREKAEVEFSARRAIVAEPFTVRLRGVKRTYGDVAEGEPLACIGSAGFLEIAVRGGSAKAKFQLHQGGFVTARWE